MHAERIRSYDGILQKFETFYRRRRRWILFCFSFLSVCLVAGVVYGWPALRQDLRNDGSSLTEKRLGAIFTAGAWSTQGGRFFTGIMRDRYGTRRVTCFALLCTAAGSLGIALSDLNNALALGASMLFVGLGSGVQLCVQPVAGLFPKHAGAILSSLSGAFQISGLVFLALSSMGSRRASFLGYCGCVIALTLCAALLLPKDRSFLIEEPSDEAVEATVVDDDPIRAVADECSERGEEEETDSSEHAIQIEAEQDNADERNSGENTPEPPKDVEEGHEKESTDDDPTVCTPSEPENAIQQDDKSPTAIEQMKSWEYAGLVVWFSILLIPLQYYVGSIGFQLEQRGDDDGFYTDIFAVCYASAAVLAPIAGYLADKIGVGIAQGIATVLSAASLFILASRNISLNAHVVGLVSYSIGRMITFGSYFTNIGKRFGYSNYGTLAGLGLLTSAIVSLLQYPLIAAASDGHDTAVNVACGIALILILPYCLWLSRRERKERNAVDR